MARDEITVQCPTLDTTQSVASAKITKQVVTQANGIKIKKALANKNNSLVVIVENTDDASSSVTFKAGDNYPNAKLGDLTIACDASSLNAYQLSDVSRFENKDGSVNVDFKTGFTGYIYAIAKSVAIG